MTPHPPRRAVRGPTAAALATALLLAASTASAQASYDVRHRFRFRPGGNVTAVQDRLRTHARVDPPPAVDDKFVVNAVPPAGAADDLVSFLVGNNSAALAHANATVNPFVPGGLVTGTIRADGSAVVFDRRQRGAADAFSAAEVRVRGGRLLRNGSVLWGPILSSSVAGSASARGRDPWAFTVLDLDTGDLFEGTLLSIDLDLGQGQYDWDSDAGFFSLDAQDFTFNIDMSSAFTNVNGTLDFGVTNGVVTQSVATGIFAGILPGVGSPGSFTVPFAPIEFDYDLGDFDGHDLDVSIGYDGAGSAMMVGAPEPGSVVLLATGGAALLAVARRRRRAAA
jgi:hypothetical protein